ncbi:MAG TPA: WYL domain-containing protein [Actinomycetota bacterium]|nr:WYL domain-containing protein [Actinomycetota bacterium]
MSGGQVGRRLRRILLLVPYAIHHPGCSLGELAGKFDIKETELRRDLELLFLCGLPGYGPGDLIDVELAGDRVYVRMADYFSKPLRLTPYEAITLYSSAAAIAALPGMDQADALKRALAKLGRALGLSKADEAGGLDVEVAGAVAHLEVIQDALTRGRRIHIEYWAASRREMTDRDVDPWGLVAALGHWYLVGLDHSSGEERIFRSDRIKSAGVLDEEAEIPADFDPGTYRGIFRPSGDETEVTLEISEGVARWFEDYYPVTSSSELKDGWRKVTVMSGSARWAAGLVLRLGPGVRKVEPEVVASAARELAAAVAVRHD